MTILPTPITDKAKIAFTSLFANDDAYWIPYVVAVKLEHELTAVTEQRDRLAEALERILEYQGRFAEEDPESIAKEALQSLTKTEL
jgi:hypothetical protein